MENSSGTKRARSKPQSHWQKAKDNTITFNSLTLLVSKALVNMKKKISCFLWTEKWVPVVFCLWVLFCWFGFVSSILPLILDPPRLGHLEDFFFKPLKYQTLTNGSPQKNVAPKEGNTLPETNRKSL